MLQLPGEVPEGSLQGCTAESRPKQASTPAQAIWNTANLICFLTRKGRVTARHDHECIGTAPRCSYKLLLYMQGRTCGKAKSPAGCPSGS